LPQPQSSLETLNYKSYSLNPKPLTLNPKALKPTLNSKPEPNTSES